MVLVGSLALSLETPGSDVDIVCLVCGHGCHGDCHDGDDDIVFVLGNY